MIGIAMMKRSVIASRSDLDRFLAQAARRGAAKEKTVHVRPSSMLSMWMKTSSRRGSTSRQARLSP